MAKLKKAIIDEGKYKRKAVYCARCTTEEEAIAYMKDNVYAEVPCKCRLRGWKKYLKEHYYKHE